MDQVENPIGSSAEETDFWIKDCVGDKKLEDEYFLGDIIGKGTSSIVYKCLRKGRTEWACKILRKDQLNKKFVQQDFCSLLKLKHPNIVQLKEVFETKEEIQLILEMAHGGELFERIVERGHYSEEDAARAVSNILNALQFLHSQGILHRGLKPENLLYQTEMDDSVLKLADYGMSKFLSQAHLASTKSCINLGYIAPEILLNKEFDSSVDLWSLGVVTYIMLCGFEPFWDEGGESATIKRIVEGDYSFPSPWWDEVSESAKELISKLLSVDPKNRPTAEEALNHPWTLGINTPTLHMNDTILRLREFNAKRRFRVATKAVLATRRALSLLSPGRKSIKEDKTLCKCLCDCPKDVRTNEQRLCDCGNCDCSPSESSIKSARSNGNLLIDGRSIGKNSNNLAAELSSQHKESFVGLGSDDRLVSCTGLGFNKSFQTDSSVNKTTSSKSLKSSDTVESKTETPKSTESEIKDIDSFDEFSENSLKKSSISVFDVDFEEDKSMDNRKKSPESNKNAINNRTTSDLERRKLEAELKASEEIAKLKQALIEKRLAVELASIQDGADVTHSKPMQHQPLQLDLRGDLQTIEEATTKKQSIIENNLAHELVALDAERFQNRTPIVRPAQPVSSKLFENAAKLIKPSGGILMSSNPNGPNSMDMGKGFNFRSNNDRLSSSEMRNVNSSDSRKFSLLDRPTSGHLEPRGQYQSTEVRYMAPAGGRFKQRIDDRNYRQSQQPVSSNYRRTNDDYNNEGSPEFRNRSVWKSMMTKIKKKFNKQPKNPDSWE